MATTEMIEANSQVSNESSIYRALNPNHLDGGLPGDNHFVMKQNHPVDDGVSMGITALITLPQLRSIEILKQSYGDGFGVAELSVAEALAPVAGTGIRIIQQDATEWGEFARAHAILTGYQMLIGREGKRKIREFQRHIVKLARKRFYPPGSDSASSVQ